MILRRRIVEIREHPNLLGEPLYVVVFYYAGTIEHGPVQRANIAECDRYIKTLFSVSGVSVAAIVAENDTDDDKIAFDLVVLRRLALRLVDAVEQFAGVSEDPDDNPTQRILPSPESWCSMGNLTEQEEVDYRYLFGACCDLAAYCESVEVEDLDCLEGKEA